MAHTPADTAARQRALDGLFQAINELEQLTTDAETREQRMTGRDSARQQANAARFPALGGQR